jgi:hypothetical protein
MQITTSQHIDFLVTCSISMIDTDPDLAKEHLHLVKKVLQRKLLPSMPQQTPLMPVAIESENGKK